MKLPDNLNTWINELDSRFPLFSYPIVKNLATYSFGLVLAGCSGLTSVVPALADYLGQKISTVEKRISEFYKSAEAKSGHNRRDFDVTDCFPFLLRWVLSLWQGKYLPLAIDVTNLGSRFHVLCVSILIRGTAIPVAWKILPGSEPESWNTHWKKLLKSIKNEVPKDWTVLILSDRGLQSPELFSAIKKMGWHPLMRIRQDGKFKPKRSREWSTLPELLPRKGETIQMAGTAFSGAQLKCTLLANWEEGYEEPWFILTDLPPSMGNVVWYSYRCWIECGFKVIKSGQWNWQMTRMSDADRAERLWLVMAVATLWTVATGAEEEIRAEQQEIEKLAQQSAQEESEEQAKKKAQKEYQRQRHLEGIKARKEKIEKQKQEQEKKRLKKKAAKAAKKKKATEQAEKQQRIEKVTNPRKPSRSKRRVGLVCKGIRMLKKMLLSGIVLIPIGLYPEPLPPPDPEITIFNQKDSTYKKT